MQQQYSQGHNNNPLCHFQTAKLGAIEQRWVTQLSVFDFEVKYRPGSSNAAALGMSLQGGLNSADSDFDDCISVWRLIGQGTVLDSSLVSKGLECYKVRQICAVESGSGDGSTRQGNTPTLPGYTKEELIGFQSNDPTLKAFQTFWDQGKRPSPRERAALSSQVKRLLKQWSCIQQWEGLLYRVVKDPRHGELWQLLVPSCLRDQVLGSVHNMGHQGIESTVNLLRERCFWVGLYEDVESWVKKVHFNQDASAKNPGSSQGISGLSTFRSCSCSSSTTKTPDNNQHKISPRKQNNHYTYSRSRFSFK